MARTDNLTNFLTDVADAIRDKKGTSGTIAASNFDTEIAGITTSEDLSNELNSQNTLITNQETSLDELLTLIEGKAIALETETVPITIIGPASLRTMNRLYIRYLKNVDGQTQQVDEDITLNETNVFNIVCNSVFSLCAAGEGNLAYFTVEITEGLGFAVGSYIKYNYSSQSALLTDEFASRGAILVIKEDSNYGYWKAYSGDIFVKDTPGTITIELDD